MKPVALGQPIGGYTGPGFLKWAHEALRALERASRELDPRQAAYTPLIVPAGDETTAITAGANKIKFRVPFAMKLTAVPRISLSTAQATNGAGGIFTVDINAGGVSIFSTRPTIDNTQRTSVGATTAAVLATDPTILDEDAEISVDVDQIGDGTAKGLKILLIGQRL